MLRRARSLVFAAALAAPTIAAADPGTPHAASVLRILGPHAERTLAPSGGAITALVKIPAGTTAASLGVVEVAPGIGMLRAGSSDLLAFSAAHPGVHMEVAPPLRSLLDTAVFTTNQSLVRGTTTGSGVVVGVADTGLDVTHPDFIDAQGHTRVAWLIDMSMAPVGKHPDLESLYGKRDANNQLIGGAVFNAVEIDALRRIAGAQLPIDEVGHGTHVTGIAAGNGGKQPASYRGFAEGATIVFARISAAGSDSFDEGDTLNGVRFLFDRGDALGKPTVVNLSLGSEVGPHDGTATWENMLASFVGPTHPGRALVVAAGNSGSIFLSPTHQSVYVSNGTKMKVPIVTQGSGSNGGVQAWITMRAGASMSVGLEGPDGEWVSPVAPGTERGHNTSGYNSGVINGVDSDGAGGSGGGQASSLAATPYALVLWSGKWPTGVYNITLVGSGTAELYVSGTGDASTPGAVAFSDGVREGTINIPATHPGIIAVGCTINKAFWTSITGPDHLGITVPVLDPVGGKLSGATPREAFQGEVCFFSSAGPTVNGVPKPEISAPGGVVVSSMSRQALPGTPGSIFTTNCPAPKGGGPIDPRCDQIDGTHAVAFGTSMSAPMVAGAIALLFQHDPTLTQDQLTALLQAGAHPFRTNPAGHVAAPFEDQGGPGELDVQGALDALDQLHNPAFVLPSRLNAAGDTGSWLTLGADYVAADESTPLTAIVELRTVGTLERNGIVDNVHRADLFDASRLQAWVTIDGVTQVPPPLKKVAPGLWTTTLKLPRGKGGSSLTMGATFDGVDIVDPKTVPIGTDIWTADYPSQLKGGCAMAPTAGSRSPHGAIVFVSLLTIGASLVRRRRHAGASPRSHSD